MESEALKILEGVDKLEKRIHIADRYYVGHGYAPADYVRFEEFKPLLLAIRNYVAGNEQPPAIELEKHFNIYECKYGECKFAKCTCEDTPKVCGK